MDEYIYKQLIRIDKPKVPIKLFEQVFTIVEANIGFLSRQKIDEIKNQFDKSTMAYKLMRSLQEVENCPVNVLLKADDEAP